MTRRASLVTVKLSAIYLRFAHGLTVMNLGNSQWGNLAAKGVEVCA